MFKNTTTATIIVAIAAVAMGSWGAEQKHAPAKPREVLVRQVPQAVAYVKPNAATPTVSARDIDCVATTIWHEARNQPMAGQIAVAEVVYARTRSPKYPAHACAVIAQRSQFSFIHNGIVPSVPDEAKEIMRSIARGVAKGRLHSGLSGAMFFHTVSIHPHWQFKQIGVIGQHVFFSGDA